MRNRRHTLRKIEGREERGNDFWGSAVDMAEFNGNARSVIRRRTYTYIYMCVSFSVCVRSLCTLLSLNDQYI